MGYAWLIICLPLAGAAILALWGRNLPERKIHQLACGAVGASFVVALLVTLHCLILNARYGGGLAPLVVLDGLLPRLSWQSLPALVVSGPTWMAVGDLTVAFAMLIDPLAMVLGLMVTGVGWLICLYSRGYMHGDPHANRFFALVSLFVGAMLTLVYAENLAMMFIGWEGVGFCSYMLIGYYTTRHSAAQAGKKAFIVNRIGDLGFLLGSFWVFCHLGTLSFPQISLRAPELLAAGSGIVIVIALCLFIGAMGKSAQFPLYVWLPDAMEGPTPVSALIHAATMVTAGVYLTVRMGVVFALASSVLGFIAFIGLLTAVMAALLAFVQQDIKKVLAYSTISQLGFMFLAVGVGAYVAAIFHLVTHAFFKGLLFLCSGSVIHGMEHAMHKAGEHGDPQDMRNMGGLWSKMPTTHWTMVVGAAALSGVPLLSGYISKHEILHYAHERNALLANVASLAALLTLVYMTRLLFKTFWQEPRMSAAVYEQVHESDVQMTQPLVVLAGLSIAGGLLNLPGAGLLHRFLHPVVHQADELLWPHGLHGGTKLLDASVLLTLVAAVLAYFLFRQANGPLSRLAGRWSRVHAVFCNLYYLDEFYQRAIIRPGHRLSDWLADVFDQKWIDGLVNGTATGVGQAGQWLRRYQLGFVRSYALWFAVGAVGAVGYMALQGTSRVVLLVIQLVVLILVGCALVFARPEDEA